MYAGGNILEDFAIARAERDLRSLIDRAPKVAHRRTDSAVEDVPVERYAGIVRMVSAAHTAKAPFVRMADRFALLLLPVTLITAGGAWYFSSDPIRALAVLVASTPCPLILAAPVAFIAGAAQAAKRGIRGAGRWRR
jgi:cation transport ATPase